MCGGKYDAWPPKTATSTAFHFTQDGRFASEESKLPERTDVR